MAAVSLLIQAFAVWLLRRGLGHAWLTRPFTLLVLAAVTYHGVSEVLLSFDSILWWSITRRLGIPQSDVDLGMVAVSLGLLGLVAGYLVAPRAAAPRPSAAERGLVEQVLDWRLAAAAAAPLLVVTVQGRGYITGEVYDASTSGLSEGLAQGFLIPTVVLAGFGFVLRHGQIWLAPVLALQTVLLTVTGQRLEIFVAAAMLVLLLARADIRPSRRGLALGLVTIGLLAVAITSVRANAGRDLYYSDTGLTSRLSAVADAIPNTFSSRGRTDRPGLVAEAATRFDGNVYVGAITSEFHDGRSPLGFDLVARSLLQPVPSVLYPDKLSGPLHEREPENAAIFTLGIPDIDYVPGIVGMYFVAVGWWLPLLMLVIGAAFALVERWTLARFTPARVVVLGALVSGAMFYERGVPGFLIQARVIVPLCVLALLLERLAPRLRHRSGRPPRWRTGRTRPDPVPAPQT